MESHWFQHVKRPLCLFLSSTFPLPSSRSYEGRESPRSSRKAYGQLPFLYGQHHHFYKEVIWSYGHMVNSHFYTEVTQTSPCSVG